MAISAIHPGEHLADDLQELNMKTAEFARPFDVPTNYVTEISLLLSSITPLEATMW